MDDLSNDDDDASTKLIISETNDGMGYNTRPGSRWKRLKRSFGAHFKKLFKTGCYVFIFFTLLKAVGLVILLTIGVQYLPISSWLEKAGLCQSQNFKLVYVNRTHSNGTVDESVQLSCPTLVPVTCPVYNATIFTPKNLTSKAGDSVHLADVFPGLEEAVDHKVPNYIPRVMCMVFTTPGAWASKARAVNETWVPRCDIHRFYYSGQRDAMIPAQDAVPLGVSEGREHLTAKTMRALRSSYFDHSNEVDWFFKADDDTYVVVDNLRWILSHFDPEKPHYVGGRSMDLLKNGYNGGGAGYALSKGAAKKIVEEGHLHPKKCKQDGAVEDLDIGACLAEFEIYPVETKDLMARLSFHPDHPYRFFARQSDYLNVYTYRKHGKDYGNPKGLRMMSPHLVSFHYMEPAHMYMYDYLLYDVVRHPELEKPAGTNKGRR